MTQPEALRLADLIRSRHGNDINDEAATELRRLHAERAAADGVINDLVAKVRELQKENTSLSAALASSCDEQRHELWESGGIAGCERARVAERQRDALQEANEAFGKRQEWWNEKMLTLEAQRGALLEALQDLCDTLGECGMTERARAAIKKVQEGD